MALYVNKFSSIPLYLQLKESIVENIRNNTYEPGDKIPTEEEISNMCNVSRSVINQALSELVAEGYLVRYKSKGTFVKSNKNTGFFKEIVSFNEEMRREGYIPKTVIIKNVLMECPEDIAAKLMIEPGEPVINIERVRSRNNEIVYCVSSYHVAKYLNGLENEDLTDASLYDLMEAKYGIQICRTNKNFYPMLCNQKYSEILEIKVGSPVQYVESWEYDQYDRLINYDTSIYIGDRSVFSVEIERNKGIKR